MAQGDGVIRTCKGGVRVIDGPGVGGEQGKTDAVIDHNVFTRIEGREGIDVADGHGEFVVI